MILTQKLEGISKKIFERYKKTIIQYIGNKPGIYALYDEKELYYVGRASDLAKRIDQHSALWTHFSVYFTKKMQYANDIEVFIISIAQPQGNRANPKLGTEKKLKDILRKAIKESHRKELKELGLGKVTRMSLKKQNKNKSGSMLKLKKAEVWTPLKKRSLRESNPCLHRERVMS